MTQEQKHIGLIIAAILGQQCFGALTFPVSKIGLETIEPYTFAFYRFLISSVVLLAIARTRKNTVPIVGKDRWRIFGLGVLIIMFNQTTYLVGQSLTASNHGAVLFATTPVWIFVLARIHLKEHVTWRRVVGVLVAVGGVAVVMSEGAIGFGTDYLAGDLIILVAVLAWAYYSILGKPLVQKYGAIRVTAYALASGSAVYFPFGLWRAVQLDYSTVPLAHWWAVVYIAIGTSVISYLLWYWVLKYMEASRVAVWHNIQPIVAAAVAFVFLNEPLGTAFVLGGTIVVVGVVITELPARAGRGINAPPSS